MQTMQKLIIILVVFIVGCGSNDTPNKSVKKEEMTYSQLEMARAFEKLKNEDVTGALEIFDTIIRDDPRNSANYIILGQVYLRLNSYSRAIDTLTAATKVDPQNGEAYFLLAIANGLAQRKAEAITAAQRSSEIYLAQRDEEKFKKALALFKSLQEAYFQDVSTTDPKAAVK